MADDLKFLSETKAAELLGMSPRTLKLRAEELHLPLFVADSGRRLYSLASIRAWQERAGELVAERRAS